MRLEGPLLLVLCALLAVVCGCGTDGPDASQDRANVVAKPDTGLEATDVGEETEQARATMKQKLEQLRVGSVSSDDLEVEYSDMHAFHGGETLTVKDDVLTGRYLFHNGGMPEQIEPPPKALTAQQLRSLVELLLEIEAWEQQVPERAAVPDESRAGLSIKVGSLQSSVWEWFNDLDGNDRVVRVKHLLEEIAGPVAND